MQLNESIPIVLPGDPAVTGINVPQYQNSWEMSAVLPDGNTVHRGFWNDTMTTTRLNEVEILRREQRVLYPDAEVVQLDEVDRKTLTPIHIRINKVGEEPHTDIFYEGNKVYGKKVFRIGGLDEVKQISMPFSYTLPHPVFDWHLWGVLISGFPLTKNYQARFLAHESYSYLPGDFRWFIISVTGQEQINAGKWGITDCWLVTVQAEVKWKIWISVNKHIAPVQQICIYNTDGTQLWWKPSKEV